MSLESKWARKPSIKCPFFSSGCRGMRLILSELVEIVVGLDDDSASCEDGVEIIDQMIAAVKLVI